MGKATPKNKVSKAARRTAIVKGLIKQQTPAAIARAVGVSRKTVYEELKAPATQELIRAWLKPYHQEIRGMIPETLAVLDKSVKRMARVEFADTLDILRTVRALGLVMGWAQGKPTDGDDAPMRRWSGTMEELLIEYRTLTRPQTEG